MTVPTIWGALPEEQAAAYPCDDLLPGRTEQWFRAVTVRADRGTVFRWLCQLKVAPYSYDYLDNFGRRSPRTLTEGADRLDVGQRVMTIFKLVDYEPDGHLTMILDVPWARRAFGDFALSYRVLEVAPGTTRLVVKMVVGRRPGAFGTLHIRSMAWGDLLMMRRQLTTLRCLAERNGGGAAG
ncbi:hypothetical protein [Streptomyces sp. TS71-3]|uniref:hypothetical protein n=1 Tax=Streptomyces sp. TS71-3 TaxID=2733862 RepID=UPI001B0F9946|nr:hypothetical protein [Streptomyces sp. TS71-3]GHJ36867.1 hypothetical protein Sm713_24760 [Streptomyces sp. TS71-3]